MDDRGLLLRRVDIAQRLLMCNLLSNWLPLYIVTEFPKSGGSWVAQMLAECLDVPFPRNARPKFESCVMHGHYKYNSRLKNTVCVTRDGRDVMVSAYFHMMFDSKIRPTFLNDRYRSRVSFTDYENVEQNLPAFIEFMFTDEGERPLHSRWDRFNDAWHKQNAPIIKYESLLVDATSELEKALIKLVGFSPERSKLESIVDKYSFENQTKRKRGTEVVGSFIRKGIAGDWKNKFSPEARRVFHQHAGKTLINLGYEPNDNWVTER